MDHTPAFHPTYARLLLALLAKQGCDTDALVRKAGLSAAGLQQGERFIDAQQMRLLVGNVLDVAAKPSIGLEMGALAQPLVHGPLGSALVASPTPRAALAALVRFAALRTGALHFTLRRQGQQTELLVTEVLDLGPAKIFVLEALLTFLAQLLQSLSGQAGNAIHCALPWPRPSWAGDYARFLNGHCDFDARQFSLRIPDSLLDAPSMTADPDAFAAAELACARKLAQLHGAATVSERVRTRLTRCDGVYPDLPCVAGEMAMSSRSLMRKLKREAHCFQGILDQVRLEKASWYLRNTAESMERIAERLGMQDTSNFSRTFRTWSGVTPSQFRRDASLSRDNPMSISKLQ